MQIFEELGSELLTPQWFEDVVGLPLTDFHHDCHAAAIALVKAGVRAGALPRRSRVARGSCEGVPGQHSWVVTSGDCYAENAKIVDPTLWSYQDRPKPLIWVGLNGQLHRPHGTGSIFDYGKPTSAGGEPIELATKVGVAATAFLDLLGPLDRRGWALLAHAPVGGWPAAEIIGAMYDTPQLSALIPIDIVGMLTDRNPQGLYLPDTPESRHG